MVLSFHGWIILTADGDFLTVRQELSVRGCDSCDAPARYSLGLPEEYALSGNSCQDCLERSYLDPRSPDIFYAPQHP